MKLSASKINVLIQLAEGESVAASKLKGDLFDNMMEEGVLLVTAHGTRKQVKAVSATRLRQYAASRLNLPDLERARELLTQTDADRASMVKITGDSKYKSHRTFPGFPVACLHPIEAKLQGEPILLRPQKGAFTYVSDYSTFEIPEDVAVVGIENGENFRRLEGQRHFFMSNLPALLPGSSTQTGAVTDHCLFVCRYPQNGSLVRWLQRIPNPYIHFGDLDLAGVHIFLTEFYQYLGPRASFLIPSDFRERLLKGSPERYVAQYARFANMQVTDPRVQPLVDAINACHRGYDQEGYIE